MRRILFFGGTFDPIHYAHLIIAEDILQEQKIQTILFLPSLRPPHKECVASFNDRVRMVNLAIKDNAALECSDIEGVLPAPSYTINTLRALKERMQIDHIAFIIGMDSAVEFSTWKDPDALLNEFEILVIPRPGYSQDGVSERFSKKMNFLGTRMIDISSTEIRERIKKGRDINYLTPDVVIHHIMEKNLYR
ncbi:MAG: nicotinate (nicotinamide) nucleotide adenylyltransferase [Candidatus Cloacimonadota bacterium]|nr:MAG: nicotinate (nicotinamide) nucleotide adenylyltransferase [Candidatus Cloacimonadota bacterium]